MKVSVNEGPREPFIIRVVENFNSRGLIKLLQSPISMKQKQMQN